MINLINGDCLEKLKLLKDNSIDSIVTDPPYGLAFMGKKWDYDVPSVDIWKEALRVLKPGGHLLSFGGTRTYHRMVINIEDAGFEIRDQIMWIYGSGFPKSMDISKVIDKQAGVEREVIGIKKKTHLSTSGTNDGWSRPSHCNEDGAHKTEMKITAPANNSAKQWQGWGTALKPANEPICLARKPISEKTVAANVLKHGTGAMNIDESRIESVSMPKECSNPNFRSGGFNTVYSGRDHEKYIPNEQGRWPANVIFDEEAASLLDQQVSQTMKMHSAGKANTLKGKKTEGNIFQNSNDVTRIGDSGGASRFFYCAKTSKAERGDGNIHPTVKPAKLMAYLIKLITPPGGTVLDPFMGSGSTGVAARELGFEFVGIERDEDYFKIATARINPGIEESA